MDESNIDMSRFLNANMTEESSMLQENAGDPNGYGGYPGHVLMTPSDLNTLLAASKNPASLLELAASLSQSSPAVVAAGDAANSMDTVHLLQALTGNFQRVQQPLEQSSLSDEQSNTIKNSK